MMKYAVLISELQQKWHLLKYTSTKSYLNTAWRIYIYYRHLPIRKGTCPLSILRTDYFIFFTGQEAGALCCFLPSPLAFHLNCMSFLPTAYISLVYILITINESSFSYKKHQDNAFYLLLHQLHTHTQAKWLIRTFKSPHLTDFIGI